MTTAEKLTVWIGGLTLIATVLGLFSKPLAIIFVGIWRKWVVFEAKITPHFDEPSKLHGVCLTLKGRTEKPYEIIGACLRILGLDLSRRMLEGFSKAQQPEQVLPGRAIAKTSTDLAFSFMHEGKLIFNSNPHAGFKLKKGQTVRFFTPINCPLTPYIRTMPSGVRIVVTTTEGDKTVLRGTSLTRLLGDVFGEWGNKPVDPQYPWQIEIHSFSKTLPDTALIGARNDKPIDLGIRTNYPSTDLHNDRK
jgi:hypothetical protein